MNDQADIKQLSYQFALRIVKLYRYLTEKAPVHEYVLSKQCLRSGTSIAANAQEAANAISKADFLAKISIAHKEAGETIFWLRLLRDSNYLDSDMASSIIDDASSIYKVLSSIVKTTKQNLGRTP